MTNQLKWRLSKLPTSAEVIELMNHKLITKEEGREILFNEETEEKIEVDSLKDEIKFLRKLVSELADKTKIVESIKYIHAPYQTAIWYNPYNTWCSYTGIGGTSTLGSYTTSGSISTSSDLGTLTNAAYFSGGNSNTACLTGTNGSVTAGYVSADLSGDFSDIQTFN